MLYGGDYGGDDVSITKEGLEALSSLTSLVHLELDLTSSDNSVKGRRALSSLIAVSHLRLMLVTFSDEAANSLARLTTRIHLVVDHEDCLRDPSNFHVSDEGATALTSLVRLTDLDLNGCQHSERGLRPLCSLTALTRLDLSCCDTYCVSPFSDEVVRALLYSSLRFLHLEYQHE